MVRAQLELEVEEIYENVIIRCFHDKLLEYQIPNAIVWSTILEVTRKNIITKTPKRHIVLRDTYKSTFDFAHDIRIEILAYLRDLNNSLSLRFNKAYASERGRITRNKTKKKEYIAQPVKRLIANVSLILEDLSLVDKKDFETMPYLNITLVQVA